MATINELRNAIAQNGVQTGSSQKEELGFMRIMLNDRDYNVNVYEKDGSISGTVCPANTAREMISSVISTSAKISKDEATMLADNHEFSKNEAQNMIELSKQFVSGYIMETGRKLPIIRTETANVDISKRHVNEAKKSYPIMTGIDDNGKKLYDRGITVIPEHDTLKVHSNPPAKK